MSDLPPQQGRVLARLTEYVRRTGETPELSSFARELGVHYVTLKQHLEALHRKGHLEFESRGPARSPILRLPNALTGVPILGGIPAGPLTEALPDTEGYLPLAGVGDRWFALRVQGDSMADLIQEDDVVLFERTPPDRNGLICAVRVEEDDVTLKYLDRDGPSRYLLRPHNPTYEPRTVAARDLLIDGVYRGLLRGDVLDLMLERHP
jgi:repressor LexA